jgi:hypothetical protein
MVQIVFTFFPLDNLNNAKKSLAAVAGVKIANYFVGLV